MEFSPIRKRLRGAGFIPTPTNVSQLQLLPEVLSYHWKHLAGMAAKTRPLNILLKKNTTFAYMAEHVEAVHELLQQLSSPNILVCPDHESNIREATLLLGHQRDW